jgi:hypothetical protein
LESEDGNVLCSLSNLSLILASFRDDVGLLHSVMKGSDGGELHWERRLPRFAVLEREVG